MNSPADPSLNPLPTVYVLQTVTKAGVGFSYRSFVFTDRDAAYAAGKQFVSEKPSEAMDVTYVVVQLEGWDG